MALFFQRRDRRNYGHELIEIQFIFFFNKITNQQFRNAGLNQVPIYKKII